MIPIRTRPRNMHKHERFIFAHGWGRPADPLAPRAAVEATPRRIAPAGTSLLLALVVTLLVVAGIARVRASTRVLELGAEITQLTDEQARLQEIKRRLLAERAYLRHPDQIADIARNRLGMVPVAPELVQEIRLVGEPPKP